MLFLLFLQFIFLTIFAFFFRFLIIVTSRLIKKELYYLQILFSFHIFYSFSFSMDSHTDTSYQDDILKVKQIWNDLKQVEKSNQQENKKHKNKNAHNNKKNNQLQQKSTKVNNQLHKTKSQLPLKKQKPTKPDNVITFSTSHPSHQPQQLMGSHSKNQPNPNSRYIESHNFRVTIEEKDKQLSLLRVSNQRLKDQIVRLQNQLSQKDSLITKFKNREFQLLGATSKFNSEKLQAVAQKVEYMNYKSDSRRLLKMLETTQEYRYFARIGLDDDGVRFLSLADKKSSIDLLSINRTQNKVHFCSCNSEFIPENYFWVPEKVYDYGRQFVKKHKGQLISQPELELLLYELNKIWRQREKRIINTVNSSKAHEVGKYKRKLREINSSGDHNRKNFQ